MSVRMMNGMAVAGAAMIALAAGAAHAGVYDFSYQFNTGDVISGYVTGAGTGTGSNLTVDIASVDSVSIDGHALNGPLLAFSSADQYGDGQVCPAASCYSPGGATISNNPVSDNFVLADNGIPGYTNYFYVIPWSNGPGNPVATQFFSSTLTSAAVPGIDGNGFVDYYNGQFNPDSFTLTAVPEPATWAMMLIGAGVAGASLRSARRKAVATAKAG